MKKMIKISIILSGNLRYHRDSNVDTFTWYEDEKNWFTCSSDQELILIPVISFKNQQVFLRTPLRTILLLNISFKSSQDLNKLATLLFGFNIEI